MSVTLVSRLEAALKEAGAEVEAALDRLLPRSEGAEARVMDAMRYAVFNGGKRLRPFLVMESARLFSVAREAAVQVAAAIEMAHCYSLVHDDLPAMDNDDLRRGKPTTHRQFDEATAILAGDALLTRAFETLADLGAHPDPAVRCELVALLARSAGAQGMVGGQMIDLIAANRSMDVAQITRLQRLKTGALFSFACESGSILGKAAHASRHALHAYAHDMGLAFQIADDLLDVEGDAKSMGKAVRKDVKAGKATFVSLLGVERARAQAGMLADQAAAHLESFGPKADLLRDLARFVIERKH